MLTHLLIWTDFIINDKTPENATRIQAYVRLQVWFNKTHNSNNESAYRPKTRRLYQQKIHWINDVILRNNSI